MPHKRGGLPGAQRLEVEIGDQLHEQAMPVDLGREVHEHGTQPDGPGWQLRVVPNRVPALRVEAGTTETHEGLLTHRPGLGATKW